MSVRAEATDQSEDEVDDELVELDAFDSPLDPLSEEEEEEDDPLSPALDDEPLSDPEDPPSDDVFDDDDDERDPEPERLSFL